MHTDAHRSDESPFDVLALNRLTEAIIGCAFRVQNTLGAGFLEKVYENALAHELRKLGLSVEQQKQISVYYDGVVVGDYLPDLVVEGWVIIEMKSVRVLDDVHKAQCINYLKATGMPVCLLMNFATPRLQIKRIASPGVDLESIDP